MENVRAALLLSLSVESLLFRRTLPGYNQSLGQDQKTFHTGSRDKQTVPHGRILIKTDYISIGLNHPFKKQFRKRKHTNDKRPVQDRICWIVPLRRFLWFYRNIKKRVIAYWTPSECHLGVYLSILFASVSGTETTAKVIEYKFLLVLNFSQVCKRADWP